MEDLEEKAGGRAVGGAAGALRLDVRPGSWSPNLINRSNRLAYCREYLKTQVQLKMIKSTIKESSLYHSLALSRA